MPQDKYFRVLIDNRELDLKSIDEVGIAISYSLEDKENFQQKNSSNALNVVVPFTENNSKIANSFNNSNSEDLTPNKSFGNVRSALIESNGQELLVGKAFQISAKHRFKPTQYEFNFYGNNADWILDMKEITLYDIVKELSLIYSKANIINSWNYNGSDVNQPPYVFAPVRYGDEMADGDTNMKSDYLKPSLNKYWILYKAFKSLGYRIKSDFLDTTYFRRQMMPWTWGNFLYSDGTRLENLGFLARSPEVYRDGDLTGFLDVLAQDTTDGAFDTNGVFTYASNTLSWTYLPAYSYGLLSATFYLNVFINAEATKNSDVELRVQWFKNGVRIVFENDNGNGTELISLDAPSVGKDTFLGSKEIWETIDVSPNDVISIKIYHHIFDSGTGHGKFIFAIDTFKIDYFKIPLGGTIDFSSYDGFKKYKILDFIGGIIDEFDMCIQTDPLTKTVYIEPQHAYSLDDNLALTNGGYFNGNTLNWSDKQDLEKESELLLFSDYERELTFRYKEDNNDGSAKILKQRYQTDVASAKYVLPDRFRVGKKEVTNRFFSSVVHYEVTKWKGLAADYPQMICLIPETVSTSSRAEAQSTFEPKSVYYKGLQPNMGWILDGETRTQFPFMFAVNYKSGGENDPVLSYCDEAIGTAIGKGLLRRFYLQRMEIMRNGQYYQTYFRLTNKDIANFLHREFIICNGDKWEVIDISNYKPMSEESTEVFMRKWSPIQIL